MQQTVLGKFCSSALRGMGNYKWQRAEEEWERPVQRVAGSGFIMYKGFSTLESREGTQEQGCTCKPLEKGTLGNQKERVH